MLKYLTVEVQISEHHTQRVTEPAWVLPILAAIHSRAEPEVIEEVLIDRPAPNVADEFARLSTRYRNVVQDDGSQGVPWVVAIYGQFQGRDSRFAQAITEATVVEQEEPEAPFVEPEKGVGDLLGTGEVSSVGG